MYIDLTQLEDEELRVEHRYDERFDLQDPDLRLKTAPKVQLAARWAAGRDVRVRGRLEAAVEVPCDRCLSYFLVPIDVEFDLFYAPIETLTPEEDVPLTPKDLAYGFYRDEKIDVDGLVREQIFLALPFRWLCAPSCRGLCPQCGIDLNKGTCSCAEERVAPYWSVLRDLKRSM